MMVIEIVDNVDNFVDKMWITLLCVRVVRTVLLFCLRVADSKVSLWYGHICDCIVFGIWYVVTTLSMFLDIILGWVTTLWVKMGLFLGLFTTFEIFECIRGKDTTERFFVFGAKTSVFVSRTRYSNLAIARRKVLSFDSQKHTIILYYYSIF